MLRSQWAREGAASCGDSGIRFCHAALAPSDIAAVPCPTTRPPRRRALGLRGRSSGEVALLVGAKWQEPARGERHPRHSSGWIEPRLLGLLTRFL